MADVESTHFDSDQCYRCGAPLDEWLTRGELLNYLHISKSQLHRLMQAGCMTQPSHTLGSRSPRWRRREIDAVMTEGQRIAGVLAPQLPRKDKYEVDTADAAIEETLRNLGAAGEQPAPVFSKTDWR